MYLNCAVLFSELTDDGWSAAKDASFDSSSEARRFFCLPCKVYFGSQDQYSTHIKSGKYDGCQLNFKIVRKRLFSNRGTQEQRILTDGRKSLLLLSLHGAMQLSGELS